MAPTIEVLPQKNLIGQRIRMNLSEDKTTDLWKNFMPRRKEIKNNIGSELYSIQVYDPSYDFKKFNPDAEFEKWAAIEVYDFETIPSGMESLTLAGGRYAVFLHKGAASAGHKTFQYIFGIWLPNSDYLLENRPHFEILGEKYKNENSDSQEEVWIPIKAKDKFS